MSRGEMSLAEVQCHLDKEGASNLVIDLIMNASSDRVFHESILLAIALLEGGNTTIQVGTGVAAGVASPPGSGGFCARTQRPRWCGNASLSSTSFLARDIRSSMDALPRSLS